MKNTVLTICLLFAFSFGYQNSYGQNIIDINRVASENTAELRKQIKFNTEQEHQVYESFLVYERQLRHLNVMSTEYSQDVSDEKKKIYAELCKSLKGILTPEQYDLFIANEEQQ